MARKKKHEMALNTNEAVLDLNRYGAQCALEADRLEHLRSRLCVAAGCSETLPCRHHGEPAEDQGEWLWSRRDGAA